MIDVFVDALDLAEMGFEMETAATGRPSYHPSVLLKLYIYGYLNRVQSSRRLEREAGGIGTMEGPIVGAVIFYWMQRYLADFGAWYLILLGTLGILVMLFAPRGLWGLVAERYGLTLFPTRRRLVVDAEDGGRA